MYQCVLGSILRPTDPHQWLPIALLLPLWMLSTVFQRQDFCPFPPPTHLLASHSCPRALCGLLCRGVDQLPGWCVSQLSHLLFVSIQSCVALRCGTACDLGVVRGAQHPRLDVPVGLEQAAPARGGLPRQHLQPRRAGGGLAQAESRPSQDQDVHGRLPRGDRVG